MFEGIGNIMELIKNPLKAGALVASTFKGGNHTLGRMRMLQEISARSAMLTSQCHNLLMVAFTDGRDISQQEIDGLNKVQLQLLQVCSNLYKYPTSSEEVNLDILRQAYGVRQGKAGTRQDAGNSEVAQIGDGKPSTA